jgi:hypothetical protein
MMFIYAVRRATFASRAPSSAMTERPDGPKTLEGLLGESPRLARLAQSAARLAALTTSAREALPPEIRPHLTAASVRDDTLVLTADSPAWAARLRFHGREILTFLAAGQGIRASRVSVRSRPA